ncbi:Prefoldin alpha subunit [Jaminaea rosea]|uniref:Prefoldin alpha subunit n=1 Tax=Jaminaea rosea TaxID=1569628 RepID=A0A316V0D5_9BASI|nr:Prefoldin alpha subunit [Jaminaea rosea]PWN30942.1 Prefoldin alpha subunit [Jaminaea rosea]
MSAQQQGQQIDVTTLSPSELLEVRQQLSQELEHLTASYGQLRSVQARFKSCIEAIANLPPASSDSSATSLIPLTSSLYVPAQLTDPSRVLVDVGTGYYLERPAKAASEMYKRKIAFVEENLGKLQGTIERKQDNLRTVGEILQVKTAQAQQQQQQAAA